MNPDETTSERMSRLKVCVIIPTYNNHKTLERVINGVLNYTANVIVVNDGSTDNTPDILKNYPNIAIVNIPKNRGKGNALRQGFKMAKALNYAHAITIDSDGQHFPADIPVLLDALEAAGKDILLIGCRNMSQEGIPKKSSFGNKFSNFWFRFETGIQLDDTQSGYRLYPLYSIPKRYFTEKFEFEIEIIVRTAWKGIEVKNIPVDILYDPEERVSHFRPFKDFTRISILNTVLVIIALAYIKPRNFLLSFKKKSLRDFFREDILESSDSNLVKASSIALGVFVGISPFWGFHTLIVISLAVILRWNKALAFAFSNISIPPMIPFVIYASLKTGSLITGHNTPFFLNNTITFELVKNNLAVYLTGSFVLATIAALVFGITSYLLLSVTKKNKNKR